MPKNREDFHSQEDKIFRLPDLTDDEIKRLHIKGVSRRQIQQAFPHIQRTELDETLERLKDHGYIYEALPGVFRSIPYPKEEWHLLDVLEEVTKNEQ